eukprot:COSAG02_NODE_4729_length_5044_cov_2.301517_3_plen_101_part_00
MVAMANAIFSALEKLFYGKFHGEACIPLVNRDVSSHGAAWVHESTGWDCTLTFNEQGVDVESTCAWDVAVHPVCGLEHGGSVPPAGGDAGGGAGFGGKGR